MPSSPLPSSPLPSSPRFSRLLQIATAAFRDAVVASLCALLIVPPAAATEPARPASDVPVVRVTAPLTPNQKVEHVLNRFTFGAHPGDEAAVSKMGLEAWFVQQLTPGSIDDSVLDAQLARFPALQLPQADLMRRFPSPQMIRQASGLKGGSGAYVDVSIPNDPAERAIYQDAIYAYKVGPKGQAGANGKKAPPSPAPNPASNPEPNPAPNMSAPAMATGDQPSADGMAVASMPADGQDMAAMQAKGKSAKKQAFDAAVPRMSDADLQAVLALEPSERYQALLNMSPPEMLSFRQGLRQAQRLFLMRGLTPAQTEVVATLTSQGNRVVGTEALEARLLRDVESNRQLQAVMADFWLNHFNVYAKKSEVEPYYLSSYERDTILPHALGKFENLLIATAESPAMLTYLDNWQSVGPNSQAAERGQRLQQFSNNNPDRPLLGLAAQLTPKGINENYARELMELHTLGVRCEVSADHPASKLEPFCGSGYTQADVTNAAKVLTGWTVEKPYQGGRMVFDYSRHEGGTKTVLGVQIKENGYKEGMQLLHMLATSPATAHFISYKMAVRFVSDNPPPALVDRMADTFLKTDGDIRQVLVTLFRSPEFWAPDVYRAKIKTPIEFVASALRASNATVNNPLPLVQAMEKLGMPIYGMQTPNGYSWAHDSWVSSNALISRMNFALVLSGDLLPGTRTDWPLLLGEASDAPAPAAPSPETERKLEDLLLGQPAAERTRATVLQEANNPTVQHAAQQSFSTAKVQDDDLADMGGTVGFRKKPGRSGREDRNEGATQAEGPEAPLDTMAGLLLGSPDFQRR